MHRLVRQLLLSLSGGKISKKSKNKQENCQKNDMAIAFFLKDLIDDIDYKERHPYG